MKKRVEGRRGSRKTRNGMKRHSKTRGRKKGK